MDKTDAINVKQGGTLSGVSLRLIFGTIWNYIEPDRAYYNISTKEVLHMKNEYILKSDILKMLDLKKNKWSSLKGKGHDVTQENFVDDVLLVLDWIMCDIEKIEGIY